MGRAGCDGGRAAAAQNALLAALGDWLVDKECNNTVDDINPA